jgi:hypothetical protein
MQINPVQKTRSHRSTDLQLESHVQMRNENGTYSCNSTPILFLNIVYVSFNEDILVL